MKVKFLLSKIFNIRKFKLSCIFLHSYRANEVAATTENSQNQQVAAPAKVEVGKNVFLDQSIYHHADTFLLFTVPIDFKNTQKPSFTTTTTTVKPVPCELTPSTTVKPNDKSEESSKEVDDTTIKPKSKSSRRRRSLGSNKRCISKLFGGFGASPILGAANPTADESSNDSSDPVVGSAHAAADDRYESDSSSKIEDNQVEESILQAVQTKKQLFGGKLSLGDPEKTLSLFKNLGSGQKNEILIHGRVPSSLESKEAGKKLTGEADSAQEESSGPPGVEAFPPPQFSTYEYQLSDDAYEFLPPSYEYFPQHRPAFTQPASHPANIPVVVPPARSSSTFENRPLPSLDFDQPILPENAPPSPPKPFVIGPSAIKSSPLYDLLSSPAPSEEVALANHQDHQSQQPGCRCSPEQFNELLHHMQSSYNQFHNGMIQLFDTFKSQVNCGSNVPQITDSSGSPSSPELCRDKNFVNSDPELAKSCQRYFAEANIDPSSGYYDVPGVDEVKAGGFRNQFLSYADYIRMVHNVNNNAGSVLSSSQEINDDFVAAARGGPQDDSHEVTVNKLRSHINNFQDVVAAPEPEPEPKAPESKSRIFPLTLPSFSKTKAAEIVGLPEPDKPKRISPLNLKELTQMKAL